MARESFNNLRVEGKCYQFASKVNVIVTDRIILQAWRNSGRQSFPKLVYNDNPAKQLESWLEKLKEGKLYDHYEGSNYSGATPQVKVKVSERSTKYFHIPLQRKEDFEEFIEDIVLEAKTSEIKDKFKNK